MATPYDKIAQTFIAADKELDRLPVRREAAKRRREEEKRRKEAERRTAVPVAEPVPVDPPPLPPAPIAPPPPAALAVGPPPGIGGGGPGPFMSEFLQDLAPPQTFAEFLGPTFAPDPSLPDPDIIGAPDEPIEGGFFERLLLAKAFEQEAAELGAQGVQEAGKAALEVLAIPSEIATEGRVGFLTDLLSPVPPGGPAGTSRTDVLLEPALEQFRQEQGREPSFLEFRELSQGALPAPRFTRGFSDIAGAPEIGTPILGALPRGVEAIAAVGRAAGPALRSLGRGTRTLAEGQGGFARLGGQVPDEIIPEGSLRALPDPGGPPAVGEVVPEGTALPEGAVPEPSVPVTPEAVPPVATEAPVAELPEALPPLGAGIREATPGRSFTDLEKELTPAVDALEQQTSALADIRTKLEVQGSTFDEQGTGVLPRGASEAAENDLRSYNVLRSDVLTKRVMVNALTQEFERLPEVAAQRVGEALPPAGAGIPPEPPSVPPVATAAPVPPDDPARIAYDDASAALDDYMQGRTPDPPPPPAPPRGPDGGGLPESAPVPQPEVPPLMGRVEAGKFPWERADQAAMDLHASAITNEERRARLLAEAGGKALKATGTGRYISGQWVPRPKDIPVMDELFDALHNPSEVAAGTRQIPAGMENIYQSLRGYTDWEQAARLDFEPGMATVQDYFYRGWKPPEGAFIQRQGSLVRNPDFRSPRADASYRELRDIGFEPLSWNPFEQWRISRIQGVKYRQQMQLVEYLKGLGDEFIQPHQGGSAPTGWRTPEIGPAFEGKTFAYVDQATGESQVGHTGRWIARNDVADVLEASYGKRPTLGTMTIGGKTFEPQTVIDWLTFVPKRFKLVGSLFQHVDFLIRSGIGSWAAGFNALRTGHPVQTAQHIIGYPTTAGEIIGSFFSPNWRTHLLKRLDDATPINEARPGVNMKAISESGLNIMDPTVFGRDPMSIDATITEALQEGLAKRAVKAVPRAALELERLTRQGLFGGVYPAAIVNDVQKNIAPQMMRTYGHLPDAQINRQIAHAANTRYSSLPATQSVIQNRPLREALIRVLFSLNENEGLLRQFTKTLPVGFRFSKRTGIGLTGGAHTSKFWVDNWLGAFLFLTATANVIHFASTGKPLPLDRYTPVSDDKWGPLPFGYNSEFASPNIPLTGRGGTEIMLDIVGQMDTVLKVLNPKDWIGARTSVPIGAFVDQYQGEDFYGKPIDEEGPGGIVSRTTHLLQQMFSPIGLGQGATNIAVQKYPAVEPYLSSGEEKLGTKGQVIQGIGLNLRGESIDSVLRRQNPDYDQMSPGKQKTLKSKVVKDIYGARTFRDKVRYQEKIWELFPPTDAARAKWFAKQERLDEIATNRAEFQRQRFGGQGQVAPPAPGPTQRPPAAASVEPGPPPQSQALEAFKRGDMLTSAQIAELRELHRQSGSQDDLITWMRGIGQGELVGAGR